MAKRKKRLKKGISSIDEAIIEHEIRRIDALKKRNEELANYLGKEIESLKERKRNREEKMYRKS